MIRIALINLQKFKGLTEAVDFYCFGTYWASRGRDVVYYTKVRTSFLDEELYKVNFWLDPNIENFDEVILFGIQEDINAYIDLLLLKNKKVSYRIRDIEEYYLLRDNGVPFDKLLYVYSTEVNRFKVLKNKEAPIPIQQSFSIIKQPLKNIKDTFVVYGSVQTKMFELLSSLRTIKKNDFRLIIYSSVADTSNIEKKLKALHYNVIIYNTFNINTLVQDVARSLFVFDTRTKSTPILKLISFNLLAVYIPLSVAPGRVMRLDSLSNSEFNFLARHAYFRKKLCLEQLKALDTMI